LLVVSGVRAGIVVTGTEVLSGLVQDANGPWLSGRLRELGVDVAHVMVVGDRPSDLRAALSFLAGEGIDLVVTSGGLGPTADDLTAEVVASFSGRPMAVDSALEERIWDIVAGMRARWREVSEEGLRAGARKQALVPEGAAVLEPVGTAPGLVVAGTPVVLVLPGPPRELQPMWEAARSVPAVAEVLSLGGSLETRIIRMTGLPESELARTLRGLTVDPELEVTTCLRRGELEVATTFPAPAGAAAYEQFEAALLERHGDRVFSRDGSTVDDIVAGLLAGPPPLTVAVAESCTGGLMAARLTDRAGSSAYMLGGVVVYSNEAKVAHAGVGPEVIERYGAVSPEVARELAEGAAERFGASLGVGITGIAGPGGGTPAKPVGTVCLCVSRGSAGALERTVHIPGDRATVRDRSTTAAMHMLRRTLQSGGTAAAA
jgi:competence/damage-inducible protein CinA-like protein